MRYTKVLMAVSLFGVLATQVAKAETYGDSGTATMKVVSSSGQSKIATEIAAAKLIQVKRFADGVGLSLSSPGNGNSYGATTDLTDVKEYMPCMKRTFATMHFTDGTDLILTFDDTNIASKPAECVSQTDWKKSRLVVTSISGGQVSTTVLQER